MTPAQGERVTRRELLQTGVPLVLIGVGGIPPRTYGYMDVRRWHELGLFGSRLLCNGEDVTMRCRAFNDREGWADCLPEPEWIGRTEPVIQRLRGTIQVVP